tara:strand:+ start:43 stop:198 length:156 start_codon:yes stop_codon:yes gene_type:complete
LRDDIDFVESARIWMGLRVGVDVDINKVSLLLEQAFEKLTENILSNSRMYI